MPSFHYFKNGEKVEVVNGANAEAIEAASESFLLQHAPSVTKYIPRSIDTSFSHHEPLKKTKLDEIPVKKHA